MKQYPLILTYRGVVGNGQFEAGVVSAGRTLLSREPEGFWIFGVDPGAVAACGKTLAEALTEFHNTYNAILFDLAAESTSFEDFKGKAEGFFHGENRPNAEEWNVALAAFRSGALENDLGLPLLSADVNRPGIAIGLRTEVRPEDTAREAPALAA